MPDLEIAMLYVDQVSADSTEIRIGVRPALKQVVHELMLHKSFVVEPGGFEANRDGVWGRPVAGVFNTTYVDRVRGPQHERVEVAPKSRTRLNLTIPSAVNVRCVHPRSGRRDTGGEKHENNRIFHAFNLTIAAVRNPTQNRRPR